jgi:class 3 adenylate cyclase
MEPRIRYAKTADGVSIAFCTLGVGMPLVHMPLAFSHVQMEWRFAEYRHWYERLAEGRMLIRYDGRGNGLSQRDVSDYSLHALSLDLEAVVNRLDLERFALLGVGNYGPVAIAYAAHNPERVSHLVLWCSWARTLDTASPQFRGIRRLLDIDWELYTETVAHTVLGWSAGEPAHRQAALSRDSVTQQAAQAFFAANRDFDVIGLLPQVRSPTLVLHRGTWLSVDVARNLAAQIGDARLVLLEGESGVPYLGDIEAALSAIDEFLGEGEEMKAAAQLPEGMAVILFTDIADSTSLTERLGDSAFRAKARALDTSLRSVIHESGGTPVEGKVLGDGVMAVFTSARQAIECALRCNAATEGTGLQLHLGIHAGDVIREGNNVYGGAVNIAARIAGASAPGELLVSDIVRGLARTSANVVFKDRGEHELKGVEELQRLFAVMALEGS